MPASAADSGYPVPAEVARVEQVIRRSRFLATVGPARDAPGAAAFVAAVRAEFPDATHHCWAFLAGPPGSTASIGLSDDGEPHGTAGRPILAALQHSGLGDVVAVVTRYYGGTNLGTGGLVRAYGGTVRLALEAVPRQDRVDMASVVVRVLPRDIDPVRRLLARCGGAITIEPVADGAVLRVSVPTSRLEKLRAALADLTRGRAFLETG